MKRRDLVRRLNGLGWFPVRQGKHEIFGKQGTDKMIPVPRHAEIDEYTAPRSEQVGERT